MDRENLGVMLEPLLEKFAEALGERPLAFWILRLDGRHFLEESPLPSDSFEKLESKTVPALSLSNQADSSPLYEAVEIVDADLPPLEHLVLEAVVPSEDHQPVGISKLAPRESELYQVVRTESPPFVQLNLSSDHPSIPKPFRSQSVYVGRIGNQKRLFGLLGFPADGSPVKERVFNEIWRSHSWLWRQMHLERSVERRTETMLALRAIGNTITSQLDVQDILQGVVEQATVLMKAKIASLMLVHEDTNQLVLESVYGSSPDYVQKPALPIDRTLLGRVVRTRRPLIVKDVRKCEAYSHRELAQSEGLVSLLSVPLLWRERCLGVLNVYSASRYRYTLDGVYLLSMLASQAAIAIQNARTLQHTKNLEEQIHDLDKRSLVGEVAAGVAHEIRNPLAAVKMLMDNWRIVDETQREDLEVIGAQIQGINRCVTQLLEIAKPRPFEIVPVDLGDEIDTILNLLRPRIHEQEISVCLDRPQALPVVRADLSRLRQMLMNLFLNALNAMPMKGDLRIRLVEVGSEAFSELPGTLIVPFDSRTDGGSSGDSNVLLSLSDSGGGAREADLKRIFDPFHTTSQEGFGIGLSVVKRIAQEGKMGIKVHNSPGAGLSFFLFFQSYMEA